MTYNITTNKIANFKNKKMKTTKELIVVTNEDRTRFIMGCESSFDYAVDIDNGTISPNMNLPKSLLYEDCIVLVCRNHPSFN